MSPPRSLNPLPAVHQNPHVNNPTNLAFASQQLRQDADVVLVAAVANPILTQLPEEE